MRLGRTTLIHFVSQFAKSIAGFIATLVIARLLGADTLGMYAVATAVLLWVSIPGNAIGRALIKRLSEDVRPGHRLGAGIALTGVISLATALTFLGFTTRINEFVGADVGHILAALLVSEVAFNTVNAALNGEKQVALAGGLQAVERVARTGIQVGLILLGFELGGLLWGYAVSLAAAAVLGAVLVRSPIVMPTMADVRSLTSFARYSWVGTMKARTFGWMDTIVLALFVEASLIGIYQVAWTLASTLVLLSISVQRTLFPEVSELNQRSEFEDIRHLLDEGLVFTGLFAVPGLVGALVVGPRILRIYRPEFAIGGTVLVVLIFARVIETYGDQFLQMLNAVDRPDVAFRINAMFIAVNLALNLVLVAYLGWVGAAIATGLAGTFVTVLAFRSLGDVIGGVSVPTLEIAKEIAASAAMGLLLVLLEPIVPSGHYVTVGLVIVGATTYGSVLVVISERIRAKLLGLVPDLSVHL